MNISSAVIDDRIMIARQFYNTPSRNSGFQERAKRENADDQRDVEIIKISNTCLIKYMVEQGASYDSSVQRLHEERCER